jgi:hypothetical protein
VGRQGVKLRGGGGTFGGNDVGPVVLTEVQKFIAVRWEGG